MRAVRRVFNMWQQCALPTDGLCVALSCPAAKQTLSPSSPSPALGPWGTASGRTPRVFVSDTLRLVCRLTVPLAAAPRSAPANHGTAQVATETRQGGAAL